MVRPGRFRLARARARARTRVDLRKPSAADRRSATCACRGSPARIEPLGTLARLTLDVAPATPHAVTQEGSRLVIRFEADALDATLPASHGPGPHSERAPRRHGGVAWSSISVRASRRSGPPISPAIAAAGRIVDRRHRADDRGRAPAAAAPPTPPPPPELPPLLDLAPAGAAAHDRRSTPATAATKTARAAPAGTLEKNVTLERRAAVEGGARVAARRARHPDARRRSERRPRRARRARQQQQGGPVHQPARQRLGPRRRCPAPRSSI